MTHPIYSKTTLEALSTPQVKTIAHSIGAIPDGDKRVKQTWVSAILDHQTMFSPAKVEATKRHIETVMNRMESVTTEPIELPAAVKYVPTPPTHSDDVAFANAMGLTYEDVFGAPLTEDPESPPQSPVSPTRSPAFVMVGLVVALVAIVRGIVLIAGHTLSIGNAIAKYVNKRVSVKPETPVRVIQTGLDDIGKSPIVPTKLAVSVG